MEGRPESPEERATRKVTVHDRRRVRAEGPREDAAAAPEGPEADGSGGNAVAERRTVEAETRAAEYLEDLQRLKAEFDNYRKRILKEQTDLVERATAGLVSRLLVVLDNFELAVAAAEQSRDFDRMLKGVELVYGELKEVLAGEGLEEIEARGLPFDPHVHEAALEVPGDPDGELVVADVLRAGFTYKGRALRPAMVKVIRRSRPQGEPAPGGGAAEPGPGGVQAGGP